MKGLLFITHQTEKFSYLDSVSIALEGGCRQIQLRMKEASVAEVERVGQEVKALCMEYGAMLYVDDHVQVCQHLQAYGLHLGKNDMAPVDARNIVGKNCVIGGTANTFEDICHLNRQGVDYIGLGPFRFTTTKLNLSAILGISGYRDIIQKCRTNQMMLPVFAIGGITVDDIPDLMQTGISGIALSSSILRAEHPIEETKKIIHMINEYTQ